MSKTQETFQIQDGLVNFVADEVLVVSKPVSFGRLKDSLSIEVMRSSGHVSGVSFVQIWSDAVYSLCGNLPDGTGGYWTFSHRDSSLPDDEGVDLIEDDDERCPYDVVHVVAISVSDEEAKVLALDFFNEHPGAFYSDFAVDKRIMIGQAMRVCEGLVSEGLIETRDE